MKQKDIKLLWGRAANKCSICKIKLSNTNSDNVSALIGEQAHIVAEKENGPRGKSNLTIEERNSYHNMILLCANHHTEIDKDVTTYPIEKLHQIKSEHELWVENSLSSIKDDHEIAIDLVYTDLIDSLVELSHLEDLSYWLTNLCNNRMSLPTHYEEDFQKLHIKIHKAIFPKKYINLERSIVTYSYILKDLTETFILHSQLDGINQKHFFAVRFYKNGGFTNPNYHEDLKKYNKWEERITDIAFELIKAVNWFADEVRANLNPLFFVLDGKFSMEYGPDEMLRYYTCVREYEDSEKIGLPMSYILSDYDKLR